MNINGTLHILLGLPGSGRYSWANWYNYNDDESICSIHKYPDLYLKDGTFNISKMIVGQEWCKNKVEYLMNNLEQSIMILIEPISLPEIKKYLILALRYNYIIDIHIPEFGYLYYPNELNDLEQIAKIKSVRCNFKLKNQIVYTQEVINLIIRDYNSIINFIKNNLEIMEYPSEPKDWIKKIDDRLIIRKPNYPSPKNLSPKTKKFLYIETMC